MADGKDPDGVLLTRAREGDDAAFAELYRRHAQSVCQHAQGDGLDADTAEDLTGEAFARTLQAMRGGGGPTASVREHLLATVRRMAARWRVGDRGERPIRSWEITHPSAETQALVQADRVILVEAFSSLPERWQEVLWRTAVEGQPLSRVGSALGLNTNATAVLAFRAREGLRQAYLQAHVGQAPTGQAECRRYVNKLAAFVRRSSNPRGLRRHLDECARCRSAYLELVDVNASLHELLPIAAAAGWLTTTASWSTGAAASLGETAGTGILTTGLAPVGAGSALMKVAIAATVVLVAGPAAPAASEAVAGAVATPPGAAAEPPEPAASGPVPSEGSAPPGDRRDERQPAETAPDAAGTSDELLCPSGLDLKGVTLLSDLACFEGLSLLPADDPLTGTIGEIAGIGGIAETGDIGEIGDLEGTPEAATGTPGLISDAPDPTRPPEPEPDDAIVQLPGFSGAYPLTPNDGSTTGPLTGPLP